MKKNKAIIITGVIVGFALGVIMPLLMLTLFVTGDSMVEFIADGGSMIFVIVCLAILGIIMGSIIALIISKITDSSKEA